MSASFSVPTSAFDTSPCAAYNGTWLYDILYWKRVFSRCRPKGIVQVFNSHTSFSRDENQMHPYVVIVVLSIFLSCPVLSNLFVSS